MKGIKRYALFVVFILCSVFVGCGEEEVSKIDLTVKGENKELKLYGWWANSDTAQIVSFSANGGSYQSDHPAIWIQFPKQTTGSWSEGQPNVELQYWDEVGDRYWSENRGACNITVTATEPNLTGTFGGVLYSSAMIKLELQGTFELLKSDYQGIK